MHQWITSTEMHSISLECFLFLLVVIEMCLTEMAIINWRTEKHWCLHGLNKKKVSKKRKKRRKNKNLKERFGLFQKGKIQAVEMTCRNNKKVKSERNPWKPRVPNMNLQQRKTSCWFFCCYSPSTGARVFKLCLPQTCCTVNSRGHADSDPNKWALPCN